MSIEPADFSKVLYSVAPEGFFAQSLDVLIQSYKEAEDDIAKFPAPERRDLRGHARRACFEKNWRKMARTFPCVRATAPLNRRKTYSHTRVELANTITLTASAVSEPGGLVRRGLFRNIYAQNSQGNLFPNQLVEDPDDAHPTATPTTYAILLHGDDDDNMRVPCFAQIAMPNTEGTSYEVVLSLNRDLQEALARANTAAAAAATPVENVPDRATPTLKRKTKEKG